MSFNLQKPYLIVRTHSLNHEYFKKNYRLLVLIKHPSIFYFHHVGHFGTHCYNWKDERRQLVVDKEKNLRQASKMDEWRQRDRPDCDI